MSISKRIEIGDLYITSNGTLSRIKAHCPNPTITMKSVISGEVRSGAVEGPIMSDYKSIDDSDKETLLKAIRVLSNDYSNLFDEVVKLHRRENYYKARIKELD